MKKSLIVAGAASLAVAAMPVVGVFAETSNILTDEIVLTVEKSCTFEATGVTDSTQSPATTGTIEASGTNPTRYLRTFSDTIALGQVIELNDDSQTGTNSPVTITVSCNSTATGQDSKWTVSAQGGTYNDQGTFVADNALKGSSYNATTNPGAIINSVVDKTEVTEGGTSYWSFKVVSPDAVVTGYDDWAVIPSASTIVAQKAPAAEDVTFSPSYRIYVGTDQEADTYTGYVTYTLADPWHAGGEYNEDA